MDRGAGNHLEVVIRESGMGCDFGVCDTSLGIRREAFTTPRPRLRNSDLLF